MAGRGGERLDERDEKIWADYCKGATQSALGRKYEISRQRVGQILERVRAELPPEDKAVRVIRHVAALDYMSQQLAELISAPPIPAYSNGRPIMMLDPETGEERVAEDHTGRLTAMRELRATLDSMAKLLGLHAKTEAAVTVDATPEVAALLARAAGVEALEA